MVYKSKVDLWIPAIALIVPVGMVVVFIGRAITNPSIVSARSVTPVVIMLGVIAFVVALFRMTDYRVEGRELKIRSFFFHWSVPIDAIVKISPTNNPLSSPALSLDRLRIDYGSHDRLMISPKDREGLIAELRTVNPSIDISALSG